MIDFLFSTLILYLKNDALFFADYWYTINEGGLFDIFFNKISNSYIYILDNIYFLLIFILIDIFLFFIGRYIYNKFKIKKEFKNIKLLAYIFRYIPILSHIGSFLLGFNKIEKSIVLKHLLKGYSMYTVLIYSIFFITYFTSDNIKMSSSEINQLFILYGSFIIGIIGVLYLIYLFLKKKLGKKH